MKREVYDEKTDKLIRSDDAKSECGKDFCNRCGDCLHCYNGDPCVGGQDQHRWVTYETVDEETLVAE
jgi:hypothetical protein